MYLNVVNHNKHVLKAEWVTLKWILPWNNQKQIPLSPGDIQEI